VTGEVIDVIPDHEQLVLPDETFVIVKSLVSSGHLSITHLLIEDEITTGEADGLLAFFGILKRATSWWIGDLLNQLEITHPEEFSQLSEATGLAETTRQQYQFVCQQVAVERRQPSLGFSHHAKVARLEPKEQNAWLKRAASKGWTYAMLVEAMRAKRAETRPQIPGTEGGNGGVDTKMVLEAAEAIDRDAHEHPDDPTSFLVPVEDITRLRAALGRE